MIKTLFDLLDKFKIPLVLILSGALLIGLGLLWPKLKQEKEEVVMEPSSQQTQSSAAQVKVDIAGAVVSPGVYQLKQDARLEEVVAAAGGFAPEADSSWVSKNINLASKISDGQKIYIVAKGEVGVSGATLGQSTTSSSININFASPKELNTLPGVGEVTANKIISARPYNKIEDLLTKKAVGKATYEKIKDFVSVN